MAIELGDAMRHIGSLIAGLGTANNYLKTSPKETCVQIFVVNFNRSIGEIKREIVKVIGVFESIIPLVGKLEDLEDSSFKSLLKIICTRLEQFDETIKSIIEVQLKDVRKLSKALLTTPDHTTDPATLSALMIDLNFAKIEVNLLQIFNKLRNRLCSAEVKEELKQIVIDFVDEIEKCVADTHTIIAEVQTSVEIASTTIKVAALVQNDTQSLKMEILRILEQLLYTLTY